MIINFKRYVATVARYVEGENGVITKHVEDIALDGRRFTDASVWKKIPRDCKLISHGWKVESYIVDTAALLTFCSTAGKLLDDENIDTDTGGDPIDDD